MKQYRAESFLQNLAKQNAKKYQSNQPFPHIYFDDFFESSDLLDVLNAFPSPEKMDFYKYDNPLEKKLAMDQVSKLPDPISQLLLYLNTPPILSFLETLTGINDLISDPYYRGGGIHQIPSGGKLDVHIDFNKYTKFNLDRRINMIVYLNKDWDPSWGGELELWNGFHDGKRHQLTSKATGILPFFNRVAIFSTSEHSYHGHPTPLACPDGIFRRSLALYYYTNGRDDVQVDAHSTTFIARPEDESSSELDQLREARNKGRLNTNI